MIMLLFKVNANTKEVKSYNWDSQFGIETVIEILSNKLKYVLWLKYERNT